jgi:hypothetical protein
MKGTEKQVAWASDIQRRYQAAREIVAAKAAALPEASQTMIMSALASIDAKLLENESAADIISRGGYAYFDKDDADGNVKALMAAVRDIAKGSEIVLTAN